MKKLLLTFLAFAAGFLPLAAQDWAPFKMGRTPYFQAGDSIFSLRITNAYVQGNDSVFEFNPRIVPDNPGVYSATRTENNIFGYQMLKTSSGEYRFLFTSGASFLLKPNAPLGQSWLFSSSPLLTATMQSKDLGMVYNFTDTIAVISLSNGDSIKVSGKHGLTQARSFLSYLNPNTTAQLLTLYRLPEAGIGTGLHAFTIFDYQPGDKFLHEGFYDSWFQPCYNYRKTTEVLSRNQNQDSIWYTLRVQTLKQIATIAPCQGPFTSEITNFDTTTFVVRPQLYLGLSDLRNEYAPKPTNYSGFDLPNFGQFKSNYHNRLGSHYLVMHLADSVGGIYQAAIDAQGFYQFAEGLGMINTASDPSRYETLIAYIKGTETYGNWQPLVLNAEDELAKEQLQVFPNPFTNNLTITLPQQGTAEITLYNLQGQKLQAQHANGEANLPLPDLPAGLYLLHVTQGPKSYTTKVQKH